MRLIICQLGDTSHTLPDVEVLNLPAIPTRKDLKRLDEIAREVLPVDDTPSLDEIAKSPDVAHMSTPQLAPQKPAEPLRIIVVGTDAGLSAVLTRLMRADNLWAEIGYVPTAASAAATNWGIPDNFTEALELALTGSVRPVPLIRDDKAIAVAATATVTHAEPGEITGEIVVDSEVLLRHEANGKIPTRGVYGAKLVAMTDQPGIAAVLLDSPLEPQKRSGLAGLLGKTTDHGTAVADTLLTGRALQAGGPHLMVSIDGESRKRPTQRVTFYRHLRDLQIVRPA